uniref:Aminotransferase-like plant mobile domain-containing protein n=1 Tax=Setaria italica TaxID=4555 RepID=K4AJR3_SETIT
FIEVAKSLDCTQRELVKSMWFHHLLDLSCNTMPKQLIMWLVNHFDVLTKTFILPNGSFTLSPLHIHQVLGIPVGGSPLPKAYNEDTRKLILEKTKCAGDKFKRVFSLFALTSCLCPTGSECASSEFYTAIHIPDRIITIDWAIVVLDKLVTSISKYPAKKSCTTAALGGCTFAMMVVYFELLDTSELNLPDSLPRISLWSTENVSTYIELDRINEGSNNFGRTIVSYSFCVPLFNFVFTQISVATTRELPEHIPFLSSSLTLHFFAPTS